MCFACGALRVEHRRRPGAAAQDGGEHDGLQERSLHAYHQPGPTGALKSPVGPQDAVGVDDEGQLGQGPGGRPAHRHGAAQHVEGGLVAGAQQLV